MNSEQSILNFSRLMGQQIQAPVDAGIPWGEMNTGYSISDGQTAFCCIMSSEFQSKDLIQNHHQMSDCLTPDERHEDDFFLLHRNYNMQQTLLLTRPAGSKVQEKHFNIEHADGKKKNRCHWPAISYQRAKNSSKLIRLLAIERVSGTCRSACVRWETVSLCWSQLQVQGGCLLS